MSFSHFDLRLAITLKVLQGLGSQCPLQFGPKSRATEKYNLHYQSKMFQNVFRKVCSICTAALVICL